ncbi:Two component regulator propeller [Duganella sp. CF517]|uniref:sensor histidine kinase n=1 Tax=Duganella sp. CF517 TaxID=1881038 RepID=UPI0008D04FD7|nr:sensor histidine kinase [Duganella sp. CF517]SEN15253.1 Two component regulator propeller [Duganella sp. CF517]
MKSPLAGARMVLASLALAGCCLLPPVCQAAVAQRPPIALHHTSWTARDGAPALVLSMTQTSDGWLWLGGPTGLYRFDGMQFEPFAPSNAALLTKNVSAVSAADGGDLWIGYRTGGAGSLRQGRIRNYDERDGLPRRAVWSFAHDGIGRTWAATAQGVFYLEGERWRAAAAAWDLPDGRYKTLLRDRRGVLWLQGDSGVYSLAPGATRFVKAPVDSGTGVLFNLSDGSVVSWDAAHARFNRLPGGKPVAQPPLWQNLGDPTALLFDRGGDLWAGFTEGVEYRGRGGIAATRPPQGLSGRTVGAIFEDKEGNIWTATSTGIDRFRSARLTRIDVPEAALGAAILADDDGGAWVGGYHVAADAAGVVRLTALWPPARGGWGNLLTGYARTGDVLWGATYGALRRVHGGDSREVALPAAAAGVMVQSVLAEDDGSVLVAPQRHGLFRLKPGGGWQTLSHPGEISVMARSPSAGLWVGYYPGLVARADGDGWRRYGPAEGLSIGLVMALHLRGPHVWAGGDNGLALYEQGRFRRVGGVNGENFDGISGIAELASGDLWLNATAGLFRIPGAEIARFKRDPAYRVRHERLDQLDGLEGAAPRLAPSPSLVQASDQRLWVVRSTGLFRLSPAERAPSAPAHPVIIKAIGAPGAAQPLRRDARFAPGSSALQIDYTIPSLALPERVRFRYRLEGVDSGWQDAGARRSAYYSNLGAGDYQFRVMASDYNGAWSDQPTSVRFSIAPAVTETWWFKAACGALLLSAAWLAYRLHIGRMTRQVTSRLQARASERERIARELHDTLLQSVQSLILHVHAAAMRLPAADTTRVQLETALRHADNVVDEGRGRILELRGDDVGELCFPDAVLAAAARLQPPGARPVELKMRGAARQLHAAIGGEALAIVTEALANAYSHAKADKIEVELQYGGRELRCIVRDDGVGIPADVVNDGGRPNHWGMRGMAERAARINARLALRSDTRGTEWQLALPAALAYTR